MGIAPRTSLPRKGLRALVVVVALTAAAMPVVALATAPTPTIQLSSSSGPVGARPGVSGSGFPRNTTVAIEFHDAVAGVVQVASTRSGSDGTIHTAFTVPANPAGGHAVFAVFATHQRSTTVWFTIVPRVGISPSRTAPLDPICVQTGFQTKGRFTVGFLLTGYPSGAQVALALVPRRGGAPVPIRTVTTGPRGSAWGSYVQPTVPSGNYALVTTTGTTALASTKTFSAWFTCYVFSGKVRPMRWRVDGVGFLPGSTVTVRWSGARNNPIFTATVRANGSWGGKLFTIACSRRAGRYRVTTSGTDGQGRPILAVGRNTIRTACG